MSLQRKIKWLLTRHPILYYIRFAIICRNAKPTEELPEFGNFNQKKDVPEIFRRVNSEMAISTTKGTLDHALQMARYLRKAIKGGRGLGLSSDKSLELMLEGKGGICSDYSQMFNVFCLLNDIRVREWGIVEKFYNPIYGHTFNEVFASELNKWIAIDFQKNLYFIGSENDDPLSAIELFKYLRAGNALKYIHFSDHVCIDMHKIAITYSKRTIPFVISRYDNKVYDHYLNKFQDRYPPFVINAMMIVLGKNYQFVFPLDDYRKKFFKDKKPS